MVMLGSWGWLFHVVPCSLQHFRRSGPRTITVVSDTNLVPLLAMYGLKRASSRCPHDTEIIGKYSSRMLKNAQDMSDMCVCSAHGHQNVLEVFVFPHASFRSCQSTIGRVQAMSWGRIGKHCSFIISDSDKFRLFRCWNIMKYPGDRLTCRHWSMNCRLDWVTRHPRAPCVAVHHHIVSLWVYGSGDLRYQHRNGSMFVRVWDPSEAGSGTCQGMMFKAGGSGVRLTVPAQVLYNGRVQKVGDLSVLVCVCAMA